MNVRIAFDPELPVVASQSFTVNGRDYKDGDSFPWQDLGISVDILHTFWQSGMIHFEDKPAAELPPATTAKVTLTAVEPPKRKR